MKRFIAPLVILSSLPFAGCYKLRRAYSGPDVPPLILAGGDLDMLKARISCDRAATLANSATPSPITCSVNGRHISVPFPMTIDERNSVQQQLLSASDEHYFKIRSHLLGSRNALTFGAEVTGVTLSAVSAILGDVETKPFFQQHQVWFSQPRRLSIKISTQSRLPLLW